MFTGGLVVTDVLRMLLLLHASVRRRRPCTENGGYGHGGNSREKFTPKVEITSRANRKKIHSNFASVKRKLTRRASAREIRRGGRAYCFARKARALNCTLHT